MKKFVLAKNGESIYHIVNHQYCDETVRYAASQLQKYLLLATGAVIPYFSDRCPSRGPEIRIGPKVRNGADYDSNLVKDGFIIAYSGENITITSSTSRGVLYGVYRFLEVFCNYRCFTKEVECIDKYDVLEINLDEIREEPVFDFRDAYFRNAFDGAFASKNRLNSSLADISKAKGGRMKWFNFHHSFNDLVCDDIYFNDHPEYFSEINGKREKNSQLCLTNPDVLRIAEQTLRKWIVENPECSVFSVAQNDNQRRCTCERCLAIEREEGSPAGSIIRFVNMLADRIKDDFPYVKLHTFAYQYSLPAPKKTVAHDNVIVRLCSISCRYDKPFEVLAREDEKSATAEFVNALNEWKGRAANLYVWDYAVNFSNYLQPFLHIDALKENIKFFKRVGVKGVLEQGNFAFGGGAAFDDLKAYIISRLLWNPDCDTDDEVNRFITAVYGKNAAGLMKEYTKLAHTICSSAPLGIYQYPDAKYITDDYVNKAEELLKRAIGEAENNEYRERIEREYLSVRFLRLTRSEMDTLDRNKKIEEFFDDVKKIGITEIRERVALSVSKNNMLRTRYMHGGEGEYRLYYIMQ